MSCDANYLRRYCDLWVHSKKSFIPWVSRLCRTHIIVKNNYVTPADFLSCLGRIVNFFYCRPTYPGQCDAVVKPDEDDPRGYAAYWPHHNYGFVIQGVRDHEKDGEGEHERWNYGRDNFVDHLENEKCVSYIICTYYPYVPKYLCTYICTCAKS